mmetsp:Transcript_30274/g.76426  ORF Transcript_30274/g.76426 Transcript_30274/m.76426 type:complete len:189 (-) Transcript_30274:185-751(-)|eukprot:CAMPEP_0183431352 /NCGR_PEP_ID=MMETSP0370-20130417/54758_1 /TAXON_ID=268820 /ORGANISM="Peridinium aciculiferum, Strain PAER-2" /LENGTH=188 /DNA_ID=CAMNT_0025617011 /DNA_START=90 /DNA_END=656 /DNA_ORIENTATION=+
MTCGTLNDALLVPGQHELGELYVQEEHQPDLRLHRWLGISAALMACMLVAASLSPMPSEDPALQGSAVGHILSLTSAESPETSFTIPRKCVYAMLVGAGVGVFGTLLAGPILGVFGFGVAGVTSGSLAALWQASMGSVAAGSSFAILQSIAAAGLGGTGAAIVTGSAATGAMAFCTGLDHMCHGCIDS